ncbi:MAG: hypothetical protein WDN67_00680 [Candidatus Moraniibacteriota bacterium]
MISHIDEFASGLAPDALTIYLGNYITEMGSVQALIDRSKTDPNLRVRMMGAERKGKPTWPAKYVMTDQEAKDTNKVSLETKKRRLGSTTYSAEMLNQPIDEATQEFPKRIFKYRTQREVDGLRTNNFLTIDTAISQRENADNTGFCDNSVDTENFWNLKAWGKKLLPKELIETIIFILHEKRHYVAIGIEKTMYLQVLKQFLDDEMRRRKVFLPIVELDHKQTMKEARIRGALQPRYESGSIYHVEYECEELEDELLRFPNSIHDDISDATAYQDQIAFPPDEEDEERIQKATEANYA